MAITGSWRKREKQMSVHEEGETHTKEVRGNFEGGLKEKRKNGSRNKTEAEATKFAVVEKKCEGFHKVMGKPYLLPKFH